MLPVLLASAACVIAVAAFVVAFKTNPPGQAKALGLLTLRIADVEFLLGEMTKRLDRRARTENLELAREVRANKAERQGRIEEEALAIIEASKRPKPEGEGAFTTREALRAAIHASKVK